MRCLLNESSMRLQLVHNVQVSVLLLTRVQRRHACPGEEHSSRHPFILRAAAASLSAFLQAAFYRELPPTVPSARKFAAHADLSHKQHSPPPHSIRWWASNCVLLYFAGLQWLLGLAGRLLQLAPAALQLAPAAAAAAVSAPSVHQRHDAAERAADDVAAAAAKRSL
jgi:hypothetical protein